MQPMRPRFREVLASTPDEVVCRLQEREAVPDDCPCRISVLGRHVEVTIDPAQRHAWSPQLCLEIEDHEGGSELHGHFGPNPAIWTTFLAAYGFVGCSSFFGVMLGVSQHVAKQTPWGLLALPLGVLGLGAVYAASLYGQRLAREQMSALASFLHAALAFDSSKAPQSAPRP